VSPGGVPNTRRQYAKAADQWAQGVAGQPKELGSALEQTKVEKPCQTLKDSDRALVPELQGGLPIGREALRPSEIHHSPNKSTPSYYSKNESFASGISKMWCVF
jgi:hypothetical protein